MGLEYPMPMTKDVSSASDGPRKKAQFHVHLWSSGGGRCCHGGVALANPLVVPTV